MKFGPPTIIQLLERGEGGVHWRDRLYENRAAAIEAVEKTRDKPGVYAVRVKQGE